MESIGAMIYIMIDLSERLTRVCYTGRVWTHAEVDRSFTTLPVGVNRVVREISLALAEAT